MKFRTVPNTEHWFQWTYGAVPSHQELLYSAGLALLDNGELWCWTPRTEQSANSVTSGPTTEPAPTTASKLPTRSLPIPASTPTGFPAGSSPTGQPSTCTKDMKRTVT